MMDWTRSWWGRTALIVGFGAAMAVAFILGTLTSGSQDPNDPVEAQVAGVWTCSMHPQIRQPGPGACPLCGMDLIPAGAADSAGGPDRVVLSDRARALARIRTTPVRRQADASAQVRLLGRIEPAEDTRRDVTAWIAGRIDRLLVNTTGEQVRRGQTLATLYSPEVYSAHQDLISARSQVDRLADAAPASRTAAQAALAAAQDRLRLLGVPAAELQAMASATSPTRSVPVRSPFAGTVIERVATEGAYVDTGATLYRIADLTTVWVQLDAYESDLSRLAVDQAVQISVDALPGELFEGRVTFIDPTLDADKRTARVRVEVDNAGGRLRPGLFAQAIVSAVGDAEDAPLVIPAEAPLFTGRRSVVYVEVPTDSGHAYEPRTVRLGPRLGEVYPVVSGLSEGEQVVRKGAFALDADLQIRGGRSMMSATEAPDEAPREPVPLTAAQRASLAPVMQAYLQVQQALANDDLPGAAKAADVLRQATGAVELPGAAQEVWSGLAPALSLHSTQIARSQDLEGARASFEPLSASIEVLLARLGNPLDTAVHVAFCPMANRNQGARWVQQGEAIHNAYFGASMARCGEITGAVDPGTYLDRGTAP